MILSLQNISMETQGGQRCSRLAVLRRELCRGPRSLRTAQQFNAHWAYSPIVSTPFAIVASFATGPRGTTGKPGGRMPAAPLFRLARHARLARLARLALDTRVNAKQEGSP